MQSYINQKTPGIRTRDGDIKVFPTLLLTFYIIAAAVFSSVTLLSGNVITSEYLSLLLSVAMPIVGIAICTKLTAGIKPLVPYCIITAIILLMGADIRVSSAIAVLMLLFTASAYLMRNKFWWLSVLAAAGTFAIAYVLTESLLLCLASIVFLPVSLALYLSFEKKMQRVGAVCAMSTTLGIAIILLFLAFIYKTEGAVSFDILRSFFDALKSELIVTVTNALVLASEQLEAGISTPDALEITTSAVTLIFNLLPAVLTVLLFIVSYVTHSLYISVISHTVDDNKEIIHAISFKMSVTSAILFLVAFFVALILDYEGEGMYAAAAQNIYMMLFPGLSLITFGFFGSLTKKKGASCLTSLIYFAIFGLVLFIPRIAAEIAAAVISISAFVGAVLVIISAIKSKTNNNRK